MPILRLTYTILWFCMKLQCATTEYSEVIASRGETVYLYCNDMDKNTRSGEWYFAEESDEAVPALTPMTLLEQTPTISVGPSSVEIQNVQSEQAGNYQCSSSSFTSIVWHLSVKDLPRRISNLEVVAKIEQGLDSILDIRWTTSNFTNPEYLLEIAEGDDIGKNWTKIIRTKKCCNLTYAHRSHSRTAQLRLSVSNKNIRSGYTDSAVFLLPNRLSSQLLEFNIVHKIGGKIYVDLEEHCDRPIMSHYTIRYRTLDYPLKWTEKKITITSSYTEFDLSADTDYIIQLIGEGAIGRYYSKQVFCHTSKLNSHGGNLTILKSWPIKINFDPPKEFATKKLQFNLNIYNRSTKAKARTIKMSKLNKTFPFTIDDLEDFEIYFVQVVYRPVNEKEKTYSTDFHFVRTPEGIPSAVENFTISPIPSNSSEYALFSTKWLPPSSPKGAISGYKLRWKLIDSPFNLFLVEQCSTSYNIKVFTPNTSYTAFVSAKTSSGYGQERKVDFYVGSSSDWGLTSEDNADASGARKEASPFGDSLTTVDRILFQAQLRHKIGHEYVVGSTRVLISCCVLMVSVMFAWFVKYVFLEAKTTNEKLKNMKGITNPQTRRKVRAIDTKRRKI